MLSTLKNTLYNQKGAALVLVAGAMAVILGMAALVIDIGYLYVTKTRLANAADASALAGAQELPGRPKQALAVAQSYAAQNGKAEDSFFPSVASDNMSLTVQLSREVDLFFARILNHSSKKVTASATAQVRSFAGGTGISPLGIVKQNFVFGQTYQLKAGAGGGYNGNYRALSLGGNGSNLYLDNLMYGNKSNTFRIGDWVPTEPGDMAGPTSQGVDYRLSLDPSATFDTVKSDSGRIVIVPVVDSFSVSGRNEVLIVGFAAFFLEGAGRRGNDSYIYGKFRQMVVPGEVSSSGTNYGVYGVTLTQ